MKQQQLIDTGAMRPAVADGIAQSCSGELVLEDVVPVKAERVFVTKPVIGQRTSLVDQDRIAHALRLLVVCYRRSIPDNAPCITTSGL